MMKIRTLLFFACLVLPPVGASAEEAPTSSPTMPEVLANSSPSDWRVLDPAETLVLDLPSGRVIMALAPEFAPEHVANIKALVAERFYDDLVIVRSQDNYVVQWGDPAEDPAKRKPVKKARTSLAPEFDRALNDDLPATLLPDGDAYAPQVGFADGFPVAVDPAAGRMWLTHCYGMVGVGRDVALDSGNGGEMYVVIGHAPRHLDLNVTLVGRVVQGIEVLSTLPRGTGPLGFYEDPEQFVEIGSVRLGSEIPKAEWQDLEVLRTDTATFKALIESRRNRHESWFASPTGHIGLCNVPLPVRPVAED
ncbi:MAG: peptidylprolyl isomerase [Thermoanaerobaculia bacterium]